MRIARGSDELMLYLIAHFRIRHYLSSSHTFSLCAYTFLVKHEDHSDSGDDAEQWWYDCLMISAGKATLSNRSHSHIDKKTEQMRMAYGFTEYASYWLCECVSMRLWPWEKFITVFFRMEKIQVSFPLACINSIFVKEFQSHSIHLQTNYLSHCWCICECE